MQENSIPSQLISGLTDSFRVLSPLLEVATDMALLRLTGKCVFLNGCLYMGSVLVMSGFSKVENMALVTSLLHDGWLLLLYVPLLTMNIFWLQDIFDLQMQKKLAKAQEEGKKLQVNFKPMTMQE